MSSACEQILKSRAVSDVREILSVDTPTTSAESTISLDSIINADKRTFKKRASETLKRPEGVNRELYNLLCSDKKDVPPIISSESPTKLGGYRHGKANLGLKKPRCWERLQFLNPGRKDDLMLSHWVKEGEDPKDYPFAKFNRVLSIPSFTTDEYDQNLKSSSWSHDETSHLFDLCRSFDLRWPVIHDRWDRERFKTPRNIEDLKERYYNVSNILSKIQGSEGTEPTVLHFDADHERRRKEQLEKLFNRTQEQIEEEEYLIAELKKIEARRKERERKAQDLQKLITAADTTDRSMGHSTGPGGSGSSGAISTMSGMVASEKKRRLFSLNKKSSEPMGGEAQSAPGTIKWPDSRGPGVGLRSHRMKVPGNLGLKKSKALEELLKEIGLELSPIPTEDICDAFNGLRSDLLLLYELRSALATCQFELESYRHQYAALTGQNLEIPQRLKPAPATEEGSSLASMDSLAASLPTDQTGTSPIKRRLNEILELTSSSRRRRTAMEQQAVLKKLKRS